MAHLFSLELHSECLAPFNSQGCMHVSQGIISATIFGLVQLLPPSLRLSRTMLSRFLVDGLVIAICGIFGRLPGNSPSGSSHHLRHLQGKKSTFGVSSFLEFPSLALLEGGLERLILNFIDINQPGCWHGGSLFYLKDSCAE